MNFALNEEQTEIRDSIIRFARQEFAEADLYIQPSITAESGDQEGIPVSLMEAQASGIPVVSKRKARSGCS